MNIEAVGELFKALNDAGIRLGQGHLHQQRAPNSEASPNVEHERTLKGLNRKILLKGDTSEITTGRN